MDLQPQWTAKMNENVESSKTRAEKSRSTKWRQFKLEKLFNERKNEQGIEKKGDDSNKWVCVYF